MSILTQKFKEVLISVLPITIIVLLLNFTLTPIGTSLIIKFLLGAFLIIIGLSIFLIGVDKGITPLGNKVGASIVKPNRLWIVLIAGLILGFFISVAEPGLIIFGQQVELVTTGQISSTLLLIVVSVGMAVLLSFGFYRLVYNLPLYIILTFLYLIIFSLALFSEPELLVIAFDASGSTTGVLAVPFILALAIGISKLKKDSKASEKDSFGSIAIVSAGAIMSVLLLSILTPNTEFLPSLDVNIPETSSVFAPFIEMLPNMINDSFFAILPLLIIFIIFQIIALRLDTKSFFKIIKGFVYAFLGLLIFLLGVNAGFMDVGSIIGHSLALFDNKLYIIIVGFVLGLVTILAEPAVHVLTKQIEDVTSGSVTRRSVLIALCFGVGVAVALSVLRVFIQPLQIWHYLLPGYIIALSLMYFVPKMFVGIAYDAGGVATGPMTATFTLAFTQGAAEAVEGADVILDGFGMIAMVALTPIISLQILGLIFKIKSKKGGLI